MNKNTLKTTALICSALFVTACGSSGNGLSTASTNNASINKDSFFSGMLTNKDTSGNTDTQNTANTANTSTSAANNTSASNGNTSKNRGFFGLVSGKTSSDDAAAAKPATPSTPAATAPTAPTKPTTPSATPAAPTTSAKPSTPAATVPAPSDTAKPAAPSTTPSAPTTSVKPSTPPATPATPSASAGGKVGTALIGNQRNVHNSSFQSLSGNSLDSIVIDGRTIALTDSGNVGSLFTKVTQNNGQSLTYISSIASGSYFSYMRFGSTSMNDAANSEFKAYNYVLGDVTPLSAMPTNGTATYSGLSLLDNVGNGWAGLEGTSKFNVDFGKKTINGTINHGPYNLGLGGTISGNSFNGTKDGLSMQGHFYGPQAQELGGIFKGSVIEDGGSINTFTGVFGAKKQ
ncbi:Slam-dependent surface lipoprotein [Neisseria sp. CCUG12390]|uniref:Slam-dependent surface lipoprotein n=1 Tax=Neisseria sp. CCUG12390 TaxID=3392035 RepID=UPI003A0FD969